MAFAVTAVRLLCREVTCVVIPYGVEAGVFASQGMFAANPATAGGIGGKSLELLCAGGALE